VNWERAHPPAELPIHKFDFAAEDEGISAARIAARNS
jgi:hypothetical protein